MAGPLAGRHVVVSGAGTGIGRAVAHRLAADGAALTLLARGAERLQETAAQLDGASVHLAPCDIRDRAAVDEAFASAAAALGPVSALVANSGVGGPNEPGDGDRFEDLVQTNLVGTYWCVRAAQRHLSAPGTPRHVVITASILARIGVAGYTGYCASKAGLLGLVRALATELAPEHVQVNAICPGWVDTSMARAGIADIAEAIGGSYEDGLELAMREVPLRRMSDPRDVAGTVAWLLSPDARGVTGQGIDINNGAWMG